MKAWVLHGVNDLRLDDVPMPVPKNGEALVKVKAAGICSSDIARVYGNGAYFYPIILGHEFSGITSDGRCVGVFPLLPCHECESCQLGRYETCTNYSYIGSRQNGAFAEYVAVPEWNLIELPNDVSFEQAALLEPAAVALHAVKKATLNNAKKVSVVGNGVIGQLIGAWLKCYGVKTVDVLGRHDISDENYDACFEAVGTSEAFQRCVDIAKPNGQIVLVGNPNSEFRIEQKLYWQILRKQLTVTGTWNSSYPSEWREVLDNVDGLGLEKFISHKYEFNELDKAFELIKNKVARCYKVVVNMTLE